VTGGAGFIGFHLSRLLLEKGFKVFILDNFSDYYSIKLKQLNADELEKMGAIIIQGSILNKEILEKSISENMEIVYHLAAQPGVRYSSKFPEKSIRVNVEGTAQVLSVCSEKKVKKIVIASSASVFGMQKYLPIDEVHPKNPISYYGVSKLATEKLVEVKRQLETDIDVSIFRPFTVIGARQRPDMAISTFVSNAMNDKPINIFGDGNQTRDWTHVKNIVDGAYLIGTKPEAYNEDFNLGSGIRTSVNEVLKLIKQEIGKDLKLNHIEINKADVTDSLADINKAISILGYQPKKTLQQAIKDFINDFKENLSKL